VGHRHLVDLQHYHPAAGIWLGIRAINNIVQPAVQATNIDVGDYNAPSPARKAGGGGGGGDRSIIEANKGKLPEKAKDTITPPQPQTSTSPSCLIPRPSTCKRTFNCPTT
jgi:hypothetical protein